MTRNIHHLRTTIATELEGATITDKIYYCFNPRPRPVYLVACDIIDKLRESEGEIFAAVLLNLITDSEKTRQYLVDNYIHVLQQQEK